MTKRILLATVSALVMAGAASAADMAARGPMYTKAPLAALPAWAGFYLGVNGGYARLSVEHTHVGPGPGGGCGAFSGVGSECDLHANGGVFGGHIGYNWQSGAWVYGLEGDMGWASLKKDLTTQSGAGGGTTTVLTGKVDALGSVRGRVGFVEGSTLFYATGGAAFGNVKSGWTNTFPASASLSDWRTGWVIGTGIERMLTPNWLFRAESFYYNLGKSSLSGPVGAPTYATEFKHEVFVSRVGISYKW